MRRFFIISGIVLVVLALLAAGGSQVYQRVRQKRTMNRAKELLEAKDYEQAALSLRRALQTDPEDEDANRMMAEVAAAAGMREEVVWRKAYAKLAPTDEALLAWANAALRYNDIAGGAEALERISEAGKATAGYHDSAARLALLQRVPGKVEEHIQEAAKLNPGNDLYRLQLASLRLGSPLPEVRAQALATVEQLAANPTIRRAALRTLIQGAAFSSDTRKMLSAAEQLKDAPDAVFEDRLVYLNILSSLPRMEMWWYLAQLRAGGIENPDHLTTLLSWMNNHGMPHVALDWARSLPEATRIKLPVCVAVAESYALLNDWKGIQPILKLSTWGELDFQRHALQARVSREQGDGPGSNSFWIKAVTEAGDRPQALTTLLRLANTWKWEEEHTNVLWIMAKGQTLAKPALEVLQKQYRAKEKTRDLLTVFERQLALEPENATVKNNVAYASLLLGANRDSALALAADAYKTEPTNGFFNGTLALALHNKGKTPEGLKLLKGLSEEQLKSPSTALCYGVLLAASGEAAEANKYLDIAETGSLLPQEKQLASKAREQAGK